MKGFAPRNLLFMRSFAEAHPDEEKVKQLVSQLPWGHIVRLIQKVKSSEEREWYIQKAFEYG
jgi:predicted nuclease of restriction endonuclease-like (RecB) superfamily